MKYIFYLNSQLKIYHNYYKKIASAYKKKTLTLYPQTEKKSQEDTCLNLQRMFLIKILKYQFFLN